jgi:two-component system, response regulator PdtaR
MGSKIVVLVVEDEPLVGLAAIEMLEDAGYAVLHAPDADEAIKLLEKHPEIRLLFTDVQMPGSMDGVKLVEACRKRWPPVRIVVTSGNPRPTLLGEDTIFVPKPYDAATLHANCVVALGS